MPDSAVSVLRQDCDGGSPKMATVDCAQSVFEKTNLPRGRERYRVTTDTSVSLFCELLTDDLLLALLQSVKL